MVGFIRRPWRESKRPFLGTWDRDFVAGRPARFSRYGDGDDDGTRLCTTRPRADLGRNGIHLRLGIHLRSISVLRSQGDPAPCSIPCKTCSATGLSDPSPPPAKPAPRPPASRPTSSASSGRKTAGEGRRCTVSGLRTVPPTPAPTATLSAPRTTPAEASS